MFVVWTGLKIYEALHCRDFQKLDEITNLVNFDELLNIDVQN